MTARERAGGISQDQDDCVIMPYTSAMKRILGQTNIRTINVEAVRQA